MLQTNWRGYRLAAWIGQFILAIAVVWSAAQGQWTNAVALAVFLIASFVFVTQDDRLPTLFDFLFVLAALLNAGGWVARWFYAPGPYDEITHAFTIFALTLAFSFWVYQPLLRVFRDHRLLYLIAITSFGIAVGAVWEIMEWAAGLILQTEVIGSLNDTVSDLLMDMVGATLAAILSFWALKQWVNPENSVQMREQR